MQARLQSMPDLATLHSALLELESSLRHACDNAAGESTGT